MTATHQKKFYITTAIPYVNARPHIGHALEFVQTDVIARSHRRSGEDVLMLSGSDENALKNVQAAEQAGVPTQEFVDAHANYFFELARALNVGFDVFQKGSSPEHHRSSQELWKRCDAAGDIYKKSYEGLYCIGCEAFYAPEELTPEREGFEHPGRKLERVAEENYFFQLSKYHDAIQKLIASGELAITPESRKNEMLAFLKEPLQDISISRSNERAKNWGVPVPDDPSQRMYVWFDALNIYQSGIGFALDEKKYHQWWPTDLHVIGKGIIRFHAIYWPAFLLSARIAVPKALFVHGYCTVSGQKMSKTLGNIVDPMAVIRDYGTDALRYYLLREIPPASDGDFSVEKLHERYNGDLANGLGNLVARVATLGERVSPISVSEAFLREDIRSAIREASEAVRVATGSFRFNEALADIWRLIGVADRFVNETKPWTITDEAALRDVLANACAVAAAIGDLVEPYLPETAARIRVQISFKDGRGIVKRGEGMVPRRA